MADTTINSTCSLDAESLLSDVARLGYVAVRGVTARDQKHRGR